MKLIPWIVSLKCFIYIFIYCSIECILLFFKPLIKQTFWLSYTNQSIYAVIPQVNGSKAKDSCPYQLKSGKFFFIFNESKFHFGHTGKIGPHTLKQDLRSQNLRQDPGPRNFGNDSGPQTLVQIQWTPTLRQDLQPSSGKTYFISILRYINGIDRCLVSIENYWSNHNLIDLIIIIIDLI